MNTSKAFWAFTVLFLIMACAAAACGPGETSAPPKEPISTPSPSGSASASASTATTAPPPTGSSVPGPAGSAADPTVVAPPPKLGPTQMAAQLAEIGLNPKALPPMNKLPPDQLRKVMKTFTKALGVSCDGCHDTKDYRAPTPHKKIAMHMWNDFTRALATSDGQPLYCDSCHGGHAEFLARKDMTALSNWMQENYVDKLKRVDGKDHGCETCHGDPMEPKIFSKLWK